MVEKVHQIPYHSVVNLDPQQRVNPGGIKYQSDTAQVDDIPTANHGVHSRGFFTVKDDCPENEESRSEDEDGYLHFLTDFVYSVRHATEVFRMVSTDPPGKLLYDVDFSKVDPYITGLSCPA